MEVIVTSELSGQLWNTCIWDPLTGTTLRTFKGGIACSKTLNIVGSDYLISSQKDKPILQMWVLNRQDQITSKMVMPGIVQVLTISPCNSFCVGAINEQLIVWQISTGKYLASLRRHYQNVNGVKFSADSSRFVSIGHEGLTLAWSLDTVLNTSEPEPDFSWSSHSLPVTDLHVTKSFLQPMVFTVSLDQTCKIHDLTTGQTLFSLQFNHPLTSVVVDPAEETCFVGAHNGRIYKIDLLDPPRNIEKPVNQADNESQFVGHEKAVTSLSVSIDACRLLSGSEDGDARIWDIDSRQCVKIFNHRGPLTNAFFSPRFKHLEAEKFQPSLVLGTFEKMKNESAHANDLTAQVNVNHPPVLENDVKYFHTVPLPQPTAELDPYIQNRIETLHQVNKELYEFAVERLIDKMTPKKKKTKK